MFVISVMGCHCDHSPKLHHNMYALSVLFCVQKGFVAGRSPIHGIVPNVYKQPNNRKALNWPAVPQAADAVFTATQSISDQLHTTHDCRLPTLYAHPNKKQDDHYLSVVYHLCN